MDLKKQSEFISCNRISFLDKKYNLHNKYLFDKQLIPNSTNQALLKTEFLDSIFIDNKSCIFKPMISENDLWQKQFNDFNFDPKKQLFNMNTKAKTSQEGNCP